MGQASTSESASESFCNHLCPAANQQISSDCLLCYLGDGPEVRSIAAGAQQRLTLGEKSQTQALCQRLVHLSNEQTSFTGKEFSNMANLNGQAYPKTSPSNTNPSNTNPSNSPSFRQDRLSNRQPSSRRVNPAPDQQVGQHGSVDHSFVDHSFVNHGFPRVSVPDGGDRSYLTELIAKVTGLHQQLEAEKQEGINRENRLQRQIDQLTKCLVPQTEPPLDWVPRTPAETERVAKIRAYMRSFPSTYVVPKRSPFSGLERSLGPVPSYLSLVVLGILLAVVLAMILSPGLWPELATPVLWMLRGVTSIALVTLVMAFVVGSRRA